MIPAPPISAIEFGPVVVRAYALCILIGVTVAYAWTRARLRRLGAPVESLGDITLVSVIAGVVGARLYHVATSWERYRDRPLDVFAIWNGGLGIWGALTFGATAMVITVKVLTRFGKPVPSATTLIAASLPGVALAQAIGRIGNWFNQELLGRPTDAWWALAVDPVHRPVAGATTYHPVFAYEASWMLLGAFFLAWRGSSAGRSIAAYVAWYCTGRYVCELLRIDESILLGGLRWNAWMSLTGIIVSAAYLIGTSGSSRARLAGLAGSLVLLVDQATKAAALQWLSDGPTRLVGETIRFELHRNPGAAFSLATGSTSTIAFIGVLVCAALWFGRHRVLTTSHPVAVGLFAGGVAGNLTDRLLREPWALHGHVVDWIGVGAFPVFNLADAALTTSVLVGLVMEWRRSPRVRQELG